MVDTYYTQSDALAATQIDPYKFIWSEEKKNVEGRRFIVGYHFDLLYWYENLIKTTRRVHEYLYHDRPLRCFFDLDCGVDKMTRKVFEEEVNNIIKKVLSEKEHVTILRNDEENELDDVDVVWLDASRETKHSVHLIFPNMEYACMDDLYSFIMENFPESQIVDYRPYTSTRSLRMAYSTSNSKSNPPMLCLNGNTNFSRSIVKLTLIHYCPNYQRNHHHHVTTGGNFNKVLPTYTPMFRRIAEWANKNNYKIIGSINEDDLGEKIKVILNGVTCEKIKRRHKSHNTYLTITLPKKEEMKRDVYYCASKYTCPDTDCNGYTWNGPNFSTIIFREEVLRSLQHLLTV